MKYFLFPLLCASPAWADSLCDVTDMDRLSGLVGAWQGEVKTSVETLEISRMDSGDLAVDIGLLDGALTAKDTLTDALGLGAMTLTLLPEARYDVDAVDDLLDATDHAVLADVLSDTPCGPEVLPQLVAPLTIAAEIEVEGTVTLIAYFTDRLLQITEFTGRSGEAVIYVTRTALLTPDAGSQD